MRPPARPPRAASSHPMVVDNQIRRVLAPLMAQLELRSPDPEARLAAVEELARRASDDDAVALRDALAREKERSVRRALIAALAELDLASEDPQRRLAAIARHRRGGVGAAASEARGA